MRYLHLRQIIYLHEQITLQSGGSQALRDQGLLESAIYRPQATFFGKDLYPDILTKAAALGYSIIQNHPFVDGNKRVGFEAMRLTLRLNRWDLTASLEKKFTLVMEIAKGNFKEQDIVNWLVKYASP